MLRLLSVAFLTLVFYPAFAADDASTSGKREPILITRETMRERVYRIIPLGVTPYETVDAVCRAWLSDGGIITHERRRGSVLVYDFPEIVDKVEGFLRGVDRAPVNIRVEIDYIGSGSSHDVGLGVETDFGRGFQAPEIVVRDGRIQRPDGVRINPRARTGTSSRQDSQFIVTSSGLPARLWVGQTIVDPSWLRHRGRNPTVIIGGRNTVVIPGSDPNIRWADVGLSLEVLPTYLDSGLIDVEVFPRVSYLDGERRRQTVKVEELSTRVTVADGQRVNIGGMINANRDKYINIFGPDIFNDSGFRQVLDMYLTARAMKMDRRPPSAVGGGR